MEKRKEKVLADICDKVEHPTRVRRLVADVRRRFVFGCLEKEVRRRFVFGYLEKEVRRLVADLRRRERRFQRALKKGKKKRVWPSGHL